ncbi:glycosyltransferase family 2 protein [Enterobacter sp. I4]|uniref:glycosyltransferase family 2 protein n=1 Tax=Enterobacter sp. I4 TaxID=2926672 RepID=UPI001F55F96B|nr:glycosyltransferase family 2 protein [Enterobacter sp. I4]MCI2291180.1 glycosyltransferase family 2 protein [Enterobacter sp. I4]
MTLSIVIVNWNAGEQLKECLNSIICYHSNLIDEVVILDNNSTDDSITNISNLKTDDFAIRLICSQSNLGFGKACNVASKNIKSKYILFLNPDAQIYFDTLTKVINYMEENNDVGVCGIKLIDSSNKIQKHCTVQPRLKHYFNHATGLSAVSSKLFPYIFLKDLDYDKDADVPHTIGAFYCIRNELFKSLKGFDELFFVYLEDLDLSRRVLDKGFRIHYLSTAAAFHKGGGTSEQVKAFRLFYSLRSRILFGFKHFPLWQAYVLLFLTIVLELFTRTLRGILHFSRIEVANTLKAYRMLYKELPGLIRRGRKING